MLILQQLFVLQGEVKSSGVLSWFSEERWGPPARAPAARMDAGRGAVRCALGLQRSCGSCDAEGALDWALFSRLLTARAWKRRKLSPSAGCSHAVQLIVNPFTLTRLS